MESIELYEQIPENGFPLRLNVNKFRKYEEEKSAEYAKYRQEKLKNKAKKK